VIVYLIKSDGAVLPLDFEERARALLPPHVSAYYAAAARPRSETR
jgi:hypothetical protein